jgi:hypothetical protein
MEKLVDALKMIKASGSFCTKRSMPANLQLEIKSFGELKLPIKIKDAKALIKLARPAKFGFREDTLLDKTIRNAWEIPKSRVKINNATWNKEFKTVLQSIRKDLGLPEDAILQPRLHNFLIYEPGQFFNYHQDSEKIDKMVATLVIVLPSTHKGGVLSIDHQGSKKNFQSSRFSLKELTLLAFYSDCHHAVMPITAGYRLVLTYNLVLAKNPKANFSLTNFNTTLYTPLEEGLQSYFSEKKQSDDIIPSRDNLSPRRLVYLLDHQYTEKNLSWAYLKGVDYDRAEALKAVAEKLDLEIYLTLSNIEEVWDCSLEYDPYLYYKRGYTYPVDKKDICLNELIVSNIVLRHWLDRAGHLLNYEDSCGRAYRIIWTKANDEFDPFQSEYEGFMGNYGNTMDRWYHRAAIVLWQRSEHYAVHFEMDPQHVMDELLMLSKSEGQEKKVSEIIHTLLPVWGNYLQHHLEKNMATSVFVLALYVKEPALAEVMLTGLNLKALNAKTAKLFLSLQDFYGMPLCIRILNAWVEAKRQKREIFKFEKLSRIIEIFSKNQDNQQTLTHWLFEYQVKEINAADELLAKIESSFQLMNTAIERIKGAIDFIGACVITNDHMICVNFLKYMMAFPILYPPIELVDVVAFFRRYVQREVLAQWGCQELFNYVFSTLKKESAQGLRDATDWSIREKVSCQCQDCNSLRNFLESKTLKTMQWPLGKDRRQHINRQIECLGIPVTHQTKHEGSPHKLILTKTDELYMQAKKRFEQVEKKLLFLSKMGIVS